MQHEHTRRFQLPYGVHVTFSFAQPDQLLRCEWDPDVPQFTSTNAKNKFIRAYRTARDDFLQDIAQLVGGGVAAIDLDRRGAPDEMTVFRPQSVQ